MCGGVWARYVGGRRRQHPVVFLHTMGDFSTVTAVAWNRSGSTVDLGAGTLFGQVVKPRLV
jgi:hypothetical protein